MALQMNIPLPGGIEHANGYVRVTDVRVCKKDDESDWFMMVDVAVYKDADSRGAEKPERLVAPAVDKFKFAYAVDDGASPADAYVLLKASGGAFADAVDV
jgi:hypothetical protein